MPGFKLHLHILALWRGSTHPVQALGGGLLDNEPPSVSTFCIWLLCYRQTVKFEHSVGASSDSPRQVSCKRENEVLVSELDLESLT